MKEIENVYVIGVYPDEIRFMSKTEPTQSVKRSTHLFSATDVVRVVDETVAREKRVAIHLEEGAHCEITDTDVRCGLFVGKRI